LLPGAHKGDLSGQRGLMGMVLMPLLSGKADALTIRAQKEPAFYSSFLID
jgi:hypothetical protein